MDRKTILTAIADYMESEGCSCCSNYEQHKEDKARLGKLLRVKKYKDGSGYHFRLYSTKGQAEAKQAKKKATVPK